MPLDQIEHAATQTVTADMESWKDIHVEAWATGLDNTVYGIGAADVHFNANGRELLAVAGRRTYSLLDDYVRVAAIFEACAGDVPQLTWAWRPLGGQWHQDVSALPLLRLKLPTAVLGHAGEYEVSGTLINTDPNTNGSKLAVYFDITLTDIPPPQVHLIAPRSADRRCGAVLDASATQDPKGDQLSFSWHCTNAGPGSASDADVHACAALAAGTSSAVLSIQGGFLGPGVFNFMVVAARQDAAASANVTVELTQSAAGTAPPAVGFSALPAEVSPQFPLSFNASLAASGICRAPAWKAWWIVGAAGEVAMLLSQTNGLLGNVLISPPFPVLPGQYKLRLVLSEERDVPWFGNNGTGSTYLFDSDVFAVDSPPRGGSCSVYPTIGNALLTSFRLGSINWIDDDLPLQYRFDWRPGSIVDDTGQNWTSLSPWQGTPDFTNAIFGRAGTITVKAAAMDTLGSTSAALAQALIEALPAVPSDSTLFAKLNQATVTGDPYASLASASAIASLVATASASGTSAALATGLFDSIQSCGALNDPTNAEIATSASVVAALIPSVVQRSFTGGSATNFTLANKASMVVSSIASAAMQLTSGLAANSANTLLDAVSALLAGVATPADSQEARVQQQVLSTALRAATLAIGDGMVFAAAVGEKVTLASSAGLSLTVLKVDNITAEGAAVGSFTIPPLTEVLGLQRGRRLTSACAATGGFASLQETRWSVNPYGYAGDRGNASNVVRPALPQPYFIRKGVEALVAITEHCCDVDEDTVLSMDIRLCRQTVEVHNLSNYIRFDVPLAVRVSAQPNLTETRVCQYFKESTQSWTDEGCYVEELFDDHVRCACNHLSAFTAAFAGFTAEFHEVIHCSNTQLLTAQGLQVLAGGDWLREQHAAVALWLLLLLLLVLASSSGCQTGKWQSQHRLFRAQFLERLASEPPADLDEQALKRMRTAATVHGRPMWLAKLMWQLQRQVLDIQVAPFEDSLMRSMVGGLGIAVVVKYVQTMTVASLGLRVVDTQRVVELHRLPTIDLPADLQPGAHKNHSPAGSLAGDFAKAFIKVRSEILQTGHSRVGKEVWEIFRMCHPILQVLQPSVTLRWSIQTLVLGITIFGTMAVSALFFLGSEHALNVKSADECEGRGVMERIRRDIEIGIISSVLTLVPTFAIVLLHGRPIRYKGGIKVARRQLCLRTVEDVVLIIFGSAYLVVSVLFTMSFLANVSTRDANHWLLSTFIHFIKDWLLVPFLLAVAWQVTVLAVKRQPRLLSEAEEVLENLGKKAPGNSKIYGYDVAGKPVLKPAWLPELSKDPDTPASRAKFRKIAESWIQAPPLPPLSAAAGFAAARMTDPPPEMPQVSVSQPATPSNGTEDIRFDFVEVEPAPGFWRWSHEWQEMHQRHEMQEVPTSPLGSASSDASVVKNAGSKARNGFELRPRRVGLGTPGAVVVDGGLPAASSPHGEDPWVTEWPRPAGTPPRPLSAWSDFQERPEQAMAAVPSAKHLELELEPGSPTHLHVTGR